MWCGWRRGSVAVAHGWRTARKLIPSAPPLPSQLLRLDSLPCHVPVRTAASSGAASSRWKSRQGRDKFARAAKVQGLKSRAAFKLLEMDAKYNIFKKGQVVVDLGYAPGSWSQVAQDRTRPTGRVLGIDLIPAQPPRGVSTIQGDFLSPRVRAMARTLLREKPQPSTPSPESPSRSSPPPLDCSVSAAAGEGSEGGQAAEAGGGESEGDGVELPVRVQVQVAARPSYISLERAHVAEAETAAAAAGEGKSGGAGRRKREKDGRMVDVLLSDMSAPWPQTSGFSVNTLSNPYIRMMNASGMSFRDHAGSMDLCGAALDFANETLKVGGHFVCKFYQGSEDKAFEDRLKKLFAKVHREKPESSRSESREAYFVALRRKGDVEPSN